MKTPAYILLFISLVLSGCSKDDNKNRITASGTIESVNVTVSSKIAGQILKLNFKEGDKVKSGDLLIELDHDLLDIQLRQAEAGVDLAYAQLKLLKSGARKEDIRQTEEQLKQAKTNLDLAKQDKERTESLYKENATTKQQLDAVTARYDVALAQYNAAKENVQKVKSIIRPEEIESAEANLKRSISSVDLLKENIGQSRIFSPVDGIVSKKFVEAGENISPATSLVRISNLETVDLVIYIPETDLAKVKYGTEAEVKIDAFKNKIYTGKVVFISPEAEFTPKNIQTPDERTKLVFAVKIQIPNPQFELKPGLPADATIKF
jgi:HlyD family secretion protein